MEIDLEISDEEYVIQRAKNALKVDPISAKAWMITAKTLYPNNFAVQFEAYLMEKDAGNIKEAAKCFSDLIGKFQQQSDLWKEIEKVTVALRAESDTSDTETQFLCEMFGHISSEVQHKLLLFTADHCEDTMEHCRLLLLLLQRFPTAISSYGPRLVDTLMSAEKHSVDGHFPINSYRKLLVCDLLPLLANENVKVDLSSKLLYKLLHKAIEFYLCYLGLSTTVIEDNEPKIEDPWTKLFGVVEFIGKQLHWEPYLYKLHNQLSKTKNYPLEDKQLLFCLSIFFLHCLYEYNMSLTPESSPGQISTSYLLVEAFTDPSLPSPVSEPKGKRGRATLKSFTPRETRTEIHPQQFFGVVNCWDLLNSSENLQREFIKLNAHLKLDPLLSGIRHRLRGCIRASDEALMFPPKDHGRDVSCCTGICARQHSVRQKNYSSCLEPILLALPLLSTSNVGALSPNLTVGGNQKHLHYLPLTRLAILQYLVKILVRCIRDNMAKHNYNELAIGHIFALVQLDWPQDEDFIPPLLEQIQQHRSFQYHNFQNYIINVDILEEITYLWTSQGGQIQLDILPHLGQRRIGHKGSRQRREGGDKAGDSQANL
ncbi:hypothetical protein NQ318_010920 [Aromia moschata]|uniref:Integrator complex subunit 10 n=1 Tax=Aromia moschata TaxID=1265417 RepID=A0AAV8XEC3_9CUCU|nr:hypothetical protein NQ318_010920 [Aromia moschata]